MADDKKSIATGVDLFFPLRVANMAFDKKQALRYASGQSTMSPN